MTNSSKIAAGIIILGIVYYFYPEDSPNREKKSWSLFDSESSSKTDKEFSGRKKLDRKSLFEEDTEFLKFVGGEEEFDPANATEDEKRKFLIEKFKPLAAKFPNNHAIPREYSADELMKMAETNERLGRVYENLISNEPVAKEERLFYYNERLKMIEDRREILYYSLGFLPGKEISKEGIHPLIQERLDSITKSRDEFKKEIHKIEQE